MLTHWSSPVTLAWSGRLTYGSVMSLHSRIKQARRHAGMTQEQLGRLVGVSKQAVTLWERMRSTPSRDNVMAVARATQTPVSWLLTGHPLPEQTPNGNLVFRDNGGRTVPLVSARQAATGVSPDAETPRIPTIFPCSDKAFAIAIVDRANAPLLMPGARVVFDPDLQPEPEDIVLATAGASAAPIIGQLQYVATADGVTTVVQPINTAFAAERSDKSALTVIAVMSEHTQPGRNQR